jgi:hypothetical protein
MAGLRKSLDSLKAEDPARNAEGAVKRGDHRYWAVQGFALRAPGAKDEIRILADPKRYRVFDKTGDSWVILTCEGPAASEVVDSTEVLWNHATHAYAQAYNRAMDHLKR